jgi:hypothetical protein
VHTRRNKIGERDCIGSISSPVEEKPWMQLLSAPSMCCGTPIGFGSAARRLRCRVTERDAGLGR